MQLKTNLLEFLNYSYSYSLYCASKPQGYIGCNLFWGLLYSTIFFIFILILIYILVQILNHQKSQNEYLVLQAQREAIADPEKMAKSMGNVEF